MRINVRANGAEFLSALRAVGSRQMPYATTLAINSTAKDARPAITRQLKRLKMPTPFTLRGTFVKLANKRDRPITAVVGVKDIQAKYLEFVELGGERTLNGKAIPVPSTRAKNARGNLPRNKIRRALSNSARYFSGVPRGGSRPAGVYQRVGKKRLRQIATWHTSTQHTPQINIGESVLRRVRRSFSVNLRRAVRRVVATAR